MNIRTLLEPAEGLLMLKDPRLVWVPLAEGQSCGVLTHDWDETDSSFDFFVEVGDAASTGFLKTASIPKVFCGEEEVVREVLSVQGMP